MVSSIYNFITNIIGNDCIEPKDISKKLLEKDLCSS